MDWPALAYTFGLVFLAEMGDKTQLATLTLAAGGSSRWLVFIAAASALVASSAVAVLAGEAVSRVVPPVWLHRIAGVAFLVLGLLYLLKRPEAGT